MTLSEVRSPIRSLFSIPDAQWQSLAFLRHPCQRVKIVGGDDECNP